MKRLICFCAALLVLLVVSPLTALAAGFQLTGPELLRPGDTITVEVAFTDCADIYAFQGELVYDPDQLTLQEIVPDERENWFVDTESSDGNITFLGYDMQLSTPLEGYVKVLSCTFVVQDALEVGCELSVDAQNVLVTDGNSDMETGLSPYRATIASTQQIAQSNLEQAGSGAGPNWPLYLTIGAVVLALAVVVVVVRRLVRSHKHSQS